MLRGRSPSHPGRRTAGSQERDSCPVSTAWSSEHGSGRDYYEATVSMVRTAASLAASVQFTTIAAVDGRDSNHARYSAVTASDVARASESTKRRRVESSNPDTVVDYADDTVRQA